MSKWIIMLALFLTACGHERQEIAREWHPIPDEVDVARGIDVGRYGGVFVYTQVHGPRTFNPFVAEELNSWIVIGKMQSGLTRLDALNNEPLPALAKDWEISEDGKRVTMRLRKGVRWSDGALITTEDVLFTFDVLYDKRYPNALSGKFMPGGQPIVVRKLSDLEFELETTIPYVPLLYDLIDLKILPKHVLYEPYRNGDLQKAWTIETGTLEPESIVGAGAFKLIYFKEGERMELVPNPHYWRVDEEGQRLPYINKVVGEYVVDTNTSIALFTSGQTAMTSDSVNPSDLDWVQRAAEVYDFSIHNRGPSHSLRFLTFNQNPGSKKSGMPYVKPHKLKWFENAEFRKAISMAIDRDGMIGAAYNGRGIPMHSVVSPANAKWLNEDIRLRYDPFGARDLLEKEGFYYGKRGKLHDSEGNRVAFEILARAGSQVFDDVLVVIQENLKSLGIDVRVTYLDMGSLVARVLGSYEWEAMAGRFVPMTGDPSAMKKVLSSKGRLHYWNPVQSEPNTAWEAAVDELMEQQEGLFDYDSRKRVMDRVQAIMSDSMPMIPLIAPYSYMGVANEWRNVKVPGIWIATWNLDEWWSDRPNR